MVGGLIAVSINSIDYFEAPETHTYGACLLLGAYTMCCLRRLIGRLAVAVFLGITTDSFFCMRKCACIVCVRNSSYGPSSVNRACRENYVMPLSLALQKRYGRGKMRRRSIRRVSEIVCCLITIRNACVMFRAHYNINFRANDIDYLF